MSWFWSLFGIPDTPEVPEMLSATLKSGTCECDHERCYHANGSGSCSVGYPADAEWPNGAMCACQCFVLDDDNGGDDEPEPETPSPEELQRMYRL